MFLQFCCQTYSTHTNESKESSNHNFDNTVLSPPVMRLLCWRPPSPMGVTPHSGSSCPPAGRVWFCIYGFSWVPCATASLITNDLAAPASRDGPPPTATLVSACELQTVQQRQRQRGWVPVTGDFHRKGNGSRRISERSRADFN